MPIKNTNKKSDKISSKKTGIFQSKFGVGVYDPKLVEDEIYKRWEESGYFQPESGQPWVDNPDTRETYCNILPPPNANGELHVGHASGYTVMDIFGRYNRMNGKKTLLLPGKDHAGIQTQVVFEKLLQEKGTSRHTLGREKFYKETYDFCIDRANYMRSQEKKIGISADWSREKFTLDPDVLKIALETFVKMEKDGLIYKGKRIVNWCPRCATALSDVEVLHKETPGKLYYIKYPLENSDNFITVATTRPETMLGDSAVAVNPKDERFADFVGKKIVLPLQNRIIPIIADRRIDKSFGTGAVKITPSHDPLDWEIGKEKNLKEFDVIDEKSQITELGGKYAGLNVNEARAQILEDLEKLGLVEKTEDMAHSVSICERCKTIIEPITSNQWFVNIDSLKKKAVEAIEKGEIEIFPANFKKILITWFENLRDWCISRQIWWGPQFPVWYCKNCGEEKYIVSLEKPKMCPHCHGTGLIQDENTFDTWFTSGQWVHTTLKSNKNDFEVFYPSEMMIMGRDLLFFWASRMIMMSLYVTRKVPFKNLFFTGLGRDKDGHKFSKSRGNGLDPVPMIEKYGADALRMSLIMDSAPGQDFRIYEEKIKTFRNFTNKLWNISRYCLSQENFKLIENINEDKIKSAADYWIIQKLNETSKEIERLFENKQISLAADILKTFTWNDFADWYIETNKIEKNKVVLGYVLDKILHMWHPFMPFVTEHIWSLAREKELLLISAWPKTIKHKKDNKNELSLDITFSLIQGIISMIRNIRSEKNIEATKKIDVNIKTNSVEIKKVIFDNEEFIKKAAGVKTITHGEYISTEEYIQKVLEDKLTMQIPLGSLIDLRKEKEKAEKEIANLEKIITAFKARLENQEFVSKAPTQVINQQKETLAKKEAELQELKKHLASLK